MYKNSLRMLEGLHAGHVLVCDSNRSIDPDREEWWMFGWTVQSWGEGLRERALVSQTQAAGFDRRFTWMRVEDLLMEDWIAETPNGPSSGAWALTEAGLAAAQERFGPVTVPVPVFLRDVPGGIALEDAGPWGRVVLVRPSTGAAATAEGAETIVVEETGRGLEAA